jgi:hypothetical protein
MMTNVGTLVLGDSMIWAILVKHVRPEPQIWTSDLLVLYCHIRCKISTFVEHGQDGFDVAMHVCRRRLALCEVALAYIGCTGPRNKRAGKRVSAHMFVVGPPVNVDDIARPMFHCLRPCRGNQ